MACVLILSMAAPGRGGEPEALEAAGRVTYDSYDPATERLEHTGQTHYRLQHHRNYTYQARVRADRAGRTLVLSVRSKDVEVWVEHTVRLPRGHDPEAEPWYKALLEHERDHVAVSTDERPRLLLRELLARPETLTRPLAPGSTPDRALAEAMVTEAAKSYQDAVDRLILDNYKRLDDLTDHGSRPIPDRARFFEDLYAPEELARLGFPFLDRVRPLLRGEAYAKGERYGGSRSEASGR